MVCGVKRGGACAGHSALIHCLAAFRSSQVCDFAALKNKYVVLLFSVWLLFQSPPGGFSRLRGLLAPVLPHPQGNAAAKPGAQGLQNP